MPPCRRGPQEEGDVRFMREQTLQLMMILSQVLHIYRQAFNEAAEAGRVNNAAAAGRGHGVGARPAGRGRGHGGRAGHGRGGRAGRGRGGRPEAGYTSDEEGAALDVRRPPGPPPPPAAHGRKRKSPYPRPFDRDALDGDRKHDHHDDGSDGGSMTT